MFSVRHQCLVSLNSLKLQSYYMIWSFYIWSFYTLKHAFLCLSPCKQLTYIFMFLTINKVCTTVKYYITPHSHKIVWFRITNSGVLSISKVKVLNLNLLNRTCIRNKLEVLKIYWKCSKELKTDSKGQTLLGKKNSNRARRLCKNKYITSTHLCAAHVT